MNSYQCAIQHHNDGIDYHLGDVTYDDAMRWVRETILLGCSADE